MESCRESFGKLVEIVETLRGEGGCDWDRKQTHESLKKHLMEESQEVLEGIDLYNATGDWDNLCEELGDVLFQVVIHSVIAQEEGIFNIEDVINGVSEKMVRRHPRVFGTRAQREGREAIPTWEEIKDQEKQKKQFRKEPLGEKISSDTQNP